MADKNLFNSIQQTRITCLLQCFNHSMIEKYKQTIHLFIFVNIRNNHYRQAGYFGDRTSTMYNTEMLKCRRELLRCYNYSCSRGYTSCIKFKKNLLTNVHEINKASEVIFYQNELQCSKMFKMSLPQTYSLSTTSSCLRKILH